MKKQFALALVFAGLVMNTSVFAADEKVSVGTQVKAYASNAVEYVASKKDTVVETVKAHPYIASATASVVTLVAMYKTCSWFRRLIGMETEEDVQKKYATAFEL